MNRRPRHDPQPPAVVPQLPVPPSSAVRPATSPNAHHLDLVRPCDGDTIRVDWLPMRPMLDRLRLREIDAPERGRPGYTEARLELLRWLDAGSLHVVLDPDPAVKRCTCNRLLGWLWSADVLVNAAMVRSGWAWRLARFGRSDYTRHLLDAQADAQRHRRGVWQWHG